MYTAKKSKTTIIFFICYLAYTSIYIARLNLTVASPEMISMKLANSVQIGMLGSIFSVIYAVGRLFNGYIGDKISPRLMICLGLGGVSLCNIFIGFLPPFFEILILWGINAYAQSMLWSSLLRVISSVYDEVEAKVKLTYFVTSVATGNILGILINTYLITSFGLKFAFIVPGILTLVFCIAIFFVLNKVSIIKSENEKHLSILSLFKDKAIRFSIAPAMFHGVMKDNISLWMTVYFVDSFKINLKNSAYFVLFIPIVGFVGKMIYPVFFKFFKRNEHSVSLFCFILCAVFSAVLTTGKVNAIAAVICLSMIYAFVSLINTSFLSIFPMHFLKTNNVSSVSGIMDFSTYLGTGLSAFIYGIVIHKWGYGIMFLSWTAVSVISVFILMKMRKSI